ncbi:MAG: NTP transferase domain-containing protein [Candidatus Aminicenantes bacterium]|nr:NTP transferase domain-containing protein [Candidatus Aminicenantes bacterium]
MNLNAVIIAGGIGSRFWPLSRKQRPKQFLPIISKQTMIEETIQRISPKIPPSQIHTIANRQQTHMLTELVPQLPAKNLLIEPQGKNTAPCLLLATGFIYLKDPESVIAVLPADHLIRDHSHFLKKLESAAAAADKSNHLITFGIPPSFPATGYGYIRFSRKSPSSYSGENFFRVKEFKEKPDQKTALRFLKSGTYFWNSGMFIWKARVFAENLKRYAPEMFSYWQQILEALKNRKSNQLNDIFHEIPSISIDYALMEKTQEVLMSPGDFGWSDVGSWSSLLDIWDKDQNQNALRGEAITIDTENCLVHNPDKLTALIGVKDLVIVNTEDALLICRKNQDQKVKQVVATLQKKGQKKYL